MIDYNIESGVDSDTEFDESNTVTDGINDDSYYSQKKRSEEISTRNRVSNDEMDNTYHFNLDLANENESIENLKNLRWERNFEFIVPIQKWYGIVKEVSEKSFIADLDDMTNGGTKESAQFDKNDVEMSERHLIEPGAIFYYYIAYMLKNGTKYKPQVIRFKRPISRQQEEFEKAMARADTMFEYLQSKRK